MDDWGLKSGWDELSLGQPASPIRHCITRPCSFPRGARVGLWSLGVLPQVGAQPLVVRGEADLRYYSLGACLAIVAQQVSLPPALGGQWQADSPATAP